MIFRDCRTTLEMHGEHRVDVFKRVVSPRVDVIILGMALRLPVLLQLLLHDPVVVMPRLLLQAWTTLCIQQHCDRAVCK